MKPLSIVHVASEMAPLVKVGGLADVVGALAAEQARRGHPVIVCVPGYQSLRTPEGWSRSELPPAEVPWGLGSERARFELLRAGNGREEANGAGHGTLQVLVVRHAGERRFFDRDGIYDDPVGGQGYPDNAERFLFFARAALEGLKRLGGRFDVLHAHDQQAAWVPCFLRTHEARAEAFEGAAALFTIHNLGYQGIYDPWVLGVAGFGRELFYPASPFEFFGRVNYMKVGIAFADLLSTVSPRYAWEIQANGEYGFGLEGVLRRRSADLRGILNGIDDAYWNPSTDPLIARNYDATRLADRVENKRALARACGFPGEPELPIVGIVSRLVEQKGFDLVEQAQPELLKLATRWVTLGVGEPRFMELFRTLSGRHPDRFFHRPSYDEAFAHQIEAGADLFLMPSRYEPCGLNQMYSLRYGCVPVVRETGGLADTVQEYDRSSGEGNGFVFQRYEAAEMVSALKRALTARRQPRVWARIQKNGMKHDFSWRRSADGYDTLYREALERVRAGRAPTLDSVRATLAWGG